MSGRRSAPTPNTLANTTISIARLAKSAAEAIGENFLANKRGATAVKPCHPNQLHQS